MVYHLIYPFASIFNPELICLSTTKLQTWLLSVLVNNYTNVQTGANANISTVNTFFFYSSAPSPIIHRCNFKPSSLSQDLYITSAFTFSKWFPATPLINLTVAPPVISSIPFIPRENVERCPFWDLRLTLSVLMYFLLKPWFTNHPFSCINPATLFPRFYPKETIRQMCKNFFTRMIMGVLLTINWKQFRCPSAGDWANEFWYALTVAIMHLI